MEESAHKKISFTAWVVAHGRIYTDIPFSNEIYEQLKILAAEQRELVPPEGTLDATVAPLFEARYKLSNKFLKQSGASQILELAAGFSPRGLELSADTRRKIIQIDLPDVTEQMRRISEEIMRQQNFRRDNLFFETGSVLNLQDLQTAVRRFDPNSPIAIIAEGLLRYLSFEEKEIVAKNVLSLLRQFGGVWITPDTHTAKHFESGLAYETNEKIVQHLQRDLERNYFRDPQHARTFFENLGFSVEPHDFTEVQSELVSPGKLKIKAADLDATIGHRKLFVMRPK